MASLLSTRLNTCHSFQEKTLLYGWYAQDSDTALQVLLHISWWTLPHYQAHAKTFQLIYTLWNHTFSNHKLQRLYTLAKWNCIDLPFILHDLQAPKFWALMNTHWAALDKVTQDSTFDSLTYFVWSLDAIKTQSFQSQSSIESYLEVSLTYHQKDISKESFKILQQAQAQGFSKQQLIDMKPPVHKLMVEDWTVSLENKQEVALYQKRSDYIIQQAIIATPYFLFVWTPNKPFFVWTHAYKQAILSYTSERARSLRFQDSQNTTVDLLISEWIYKKIYIRWTEEESNHRFDTSRQYTHQDQNYEVNSLFESESGLSEISHLMTSNQDLIFRSPTTWTALVEWVSGSWKTNLIFHRIDYLLQEHSKQFQANKITIYTPNKILAAYMQAALSSTSFSFKDTALIQSFDSILPLPHPQKSTRESMDTLLLNQELKKLFSELHNRFLSTLERLTVELLEHITSTQQALITLHGSRSALDQHVHRKWYTNDIALLEKLIKKVSHIVKESAKTPKKYIQFIQNTIQSVLYTTYIDWNDSLRVKQWYHTALFEKLEHWLNKTIEAQHRVLLEPYIDSHTQKLIASSFSIEFQSLLNKLYVDEYHLVQEVLLISLFDFIGKYIPYTNYQYVLVDEFQDFHPLALRILSLLYGRSMILSGDFMQSARYSGTWDLENLWIILVDHRTMRDNFRNTLETIQYAHSIFGKDIDSLFLAQRVVKRGPHPIIIKKDWIIEQISTFLSAIKTTETVAIIYYDIERAKKLFTQYSADPTNQALFPSLDIAHFEELVSWYYSHQVYFISYRESKGLEFDHVLLIDSQTLLSSTLHYKKKLWYIGCTRAVKTLSVVK